MSAITKLRTVRFAPYRKGMGPTFSLMTWDAGERYEGGSRRTYLRYRLAMRQPGENLSTTVFEASDFGCSPMHAIDSDETLRSLLTFLTLRPGDTDSEYFEAYTPEQMAFCDHHAEALAMAAFDRFGEG